MVAAVVVAAEAADVILLPVLPVVGLLLAAALLLAFGAAALAAVARGVKAPCRCFGASVRPLGRSHAVRNGALVLAVLTISFDDVADLFSGRSTPVGAGRATERI